jgi:hypothetical protein
MSLLQTFINITKQLYPTGRVFRMADNSFLRKLHEGLAQSEKRAYDDALSTLDSALPDNNNFTADDATAWEHRLGLITNEAVPLADRKAAIIRKMNHPGTVPARENYRFLELQLQLAGFNVYVFENRFHDGFGGYFTKSPEEFSGETFDTVQYGDPPQYGDAQYGDSIYNLVVNSLDENVDASFNIGDNLKSTFFIGAMYPGEFADVDAERKDEFRQLILRIKPVQTVGILLVNYI